MIARLQAQPGADAIGVTIGDFAHTQVDRTFPLAYLLRNTITNLTTQDAQVDRFRNVAAHLEPGGLFVIENYIPELRRVPPGKTVHVFAWTPAHLSFDGRLGTFASPHRYLWPRNWTSWPGQRT